MKKLTLRQKRIIRNGLASARRNSPSQRAVVTYQFLAGVEAACVALGMEFPAEFVDIKLKT